LLIDRIVYDREENSVTLQSNLGKRISVNSKDLFLYSLTKNRAIEDYPFGPDVIV